MSNLKFFKGLEKNLPQDNKLLLEKESFYLTEFDYNFYYSDTDKNLHLLFAEPSIKLKEMHTYYNISPKASIPNSFPPSDDSGWIPTEPQDFEGGKPGHIINCKVYMDGTFKYSQINNLITEADIDEICKDD